jgi:Tfp pilus assembly protein PilE
MTSESLQSDGGFSSVTVSSASATTYTLTAAILPVDRECGDLTLDQYGQKGASGAQEVSFCW